MKTTVLASACIAALLLSSAVSAQTAPGPRPLVGGHGNNVLAFIAEHDDNADGRVTWQEFETFRRTRFDATDTDRNGTVEEAEYVAEFDARVAAEIERERAAQVEQTKARFAALDTDKSGQVSRAEFDAAGEKTWQGGQKALVSRTSKNKTAPEREAKTAAGAQRFDNQRRSRIGMPTSHTAAGFLELYDENGDGKVERAEYERVRDAQFARTDSNSDGLLALEEYLAEFETRVDRRIDALDQGGDRQVHVRFGVLDADKDGHMTFAEYQVSGKRLFETADRNKDGVVDAVDARLPAPEPRR
ncbi:EF-hand domain-containing protein [Stenotrophomonas sp. PFBMAA-4]|uniref:EF-hand domain-containing protein n=1 Tax=Stenotrophomonas sp. PFBMAA-4 TaxID=3043301 RepID=UPI0024B5DEF2|nr:EF-hand domain-containing protein [Stenotrophomonas sp. PFBMAA-4]MDI9271540.1 EF-hand domain-containing protein [Stenotrophomonas sp. PFBMAA-4]